MSGYSRRQIGRNTFYITALGTLVIDQISKAIARSTLGSGRIVELVPNFFSFRLVENPGAAFGALGSWPPVLILIGIIAIFAIFGLRKEREKSKVLALSLGLLLGGAGGNLIDRILSGHVTDFLHFAASVGTKALEWPTFNLADVAITIGGVLLVYHMILDESKKKVELETH